MMRASMLLLAALAVSAAEGPRIFIVTDLEGVGGVHNWDEQVSPGQRRFEESRRLLTGEVNAAVEGVFDAGASQVVIWDGHGGSRTLSIEDIHPRARLVQGRRTPATFYLEERLYDGLIIVGQHAMAGAKGLLAHSQSRNVRGIFLNGKPVGEIGQIAAIAGYFHIPVIMLTGDQAACDEMLALQPKAETVAVKRLVGTESALSLPHAEARAQIRAHARRALARIREFSPWIVEGPVELRFEYLPETPEKGQALERPPRVFRGRSVLEAYQEWLGR